MPQKPYNCHTYRIIVTPYIIKKMYLCNQNQPQTKPLMNELTRFITETPLWLTIIFFAVFAAMSIWCLVLLVQALRGK